MPLIQLLAVIWPNDVARYPYQQQTLLQLALNLGIGRENDHYPVVIGLAEELYAPDRITPSNCDGLYAGPSR